ncbi:MAG TPA: YciI family protein [Candidatus Sulfotelmatobacter sp.]|jgi:uncharacterized protein YciI|nr:YciI family protein [Candidatus Sulfotelmatobacter sp.]
MFMVILRYKVPLDRIDAALAAHKAWLDVHFSAGRFILAGRQEPRTGGVILAQGCTRDELTAILAEDPFSRQALADYEIIHVPNCKVDSRLSFLKA